MRFSMTPIRWSGSQVDWNRAARLSNSIRCSCTLRWKYWPSKLPPYSWDASIRYLESSSQMILLTPSPLLLLTIGCPKYTIEINASDPGKTVATVVNCLALWTVVPLSACTLIGGRDPVDSSLELRRSKFCFWLLWQQKTESCDLILPYRSHLSQLSLFPFHMILNFSHL